MNNTKYQIKDLTFIALMAAVMCILGPLSIPIGSVPISFTNLVIYITMYVLDTKRGTVAYLLYLLIGLVGVPVFSGFTAGPGKLLGPTGGYLIGFIFMAVITGFFTERFADKHAVCILGMILATAVCYTFGTAWLAYSAQMSFKSALAVGVLPFIIEDLIKIIFSAFIGYTLRVRLAKAGFAIKRKTV